MDLSNTVGYSSAAGLLVLQIKHMVVAVVSEPARWTQSSLPAVHNVQVNATSQLNMYCSARGNPAPLIAWTKDGQTIDGSGASWYTVASSVRSMDTYSNIVVSTLSWQGSVIVSTSFLVLLSFFSTGNVAT